MAITKVDLGTHAIRETPAARLFRRRLHCPDILTFFHLGTREWILARWLSRPAYLVEEIEDLGGQFEKMTPDLVQQIVSCWGPVDWAAKKRRLIECHRNRERKQVDDMLKRQDEYAWLRKRTKDIAPVPYVIQAPVEG